MSFLLPGRRKSVLFFFFIVKKIEQLRRDIKENNRFKTFTFFVVRTAESNSIIVCI